MKKIIILLLLLPHFGFGQSDNDTLIEQPAKYRTGINDLFLFINQNIKYPGIAKNNNYQGKVYLRFLIDTLGNVSNIIVLNKGNQHESLEKEAKRVISLTNGKWDPGRNNNTKVNTNFTLPINFQLGFSQPIVNTNTGNPFKKIDHNKLEFLTEKLDSTPVLINKINLFSIINKKLNHLNTSLNIVFKINKKGKTIGVYILDSYRLLSKEEKSEIYNTFTSLKWYPGIMNGYPTNTKCQYQIKLSSNKE